MYPLHIRCVPASPGANVTALPWLLPARLWGSPGSDVHASRSASLSDTQRMLATQCRAEEMGTSQPGRRCGSRLQGWRAGSRKYQTTISEFRFSAPRSMRMGKPSVTSALGLGSPLPHLRWDWAPRFCGRRGPVSRPWNIWRTPGMQHTALIMHGSETKPFDNVQLSACYYVHPGIPYNMVSHNDLTTVQSRASLFA